MNTNTPQCEICGQPATDFINEPVELAPKNGWRQFAPGPRHAYCPQHAPPFSPEEQAIFAKLQAMAPDTSKV